MRIAAELLQEMVAHAQEEAPAECCGMVATRADQIVAVHRATNAEASPFRFVIDGRQQLQILNRIEAEALELGAIYHSHTRTAPEPSQTDINFAQAWPGVLWVIVGLAGDEPEVRTWRIDDGRVDEVELVVE
jgi:[CysO sulfur-carrier protein]-S-L-cysteine hydrolase